LTDLATAGLIGGSGAASGEMLFAVLDQSQDCIKVLGPEGRLDFMNRNGRCVMEIDDFADVAGRRWWDLWPEEARSSVEGAVVAARAGRASHFEAFCPTAKGNPKWWDVAVTPVFGADGDLFAILSISRDVSDQVRARERLRELAAEMRHRLRNAFAVASAIAMQSARGDEERTRFGQTLSARFAAVARVQSALLDADSRSWKLGELLAEVVSGHGESDARIDIGTLPECEVDGTGALLVALVFNELATNSLKYGALAGDGRPAISAAVEDGRLRLVWSEATSRSEPAGKGHGSGYAMMERLARAQRARLETKWSDDGLEVVLDLPA
jgi:PAS domain S-box-containing protein